MSIEFLSFGPNVKIRKEKKVYLSYFIDFKRILTVNKTGAFIIDLFFNKNYSLKQISEILNKNDLKKEQIKNFLIDIKRELEKPYEGGYPLIESDQMNIPLAVEIQINTLCNLRCSHCCQKDYQRIMPFKKIINILEVLYKHNVFEIVLVGGEVFLHPDIEKIIRLSCEKYRFNVTVVSNGTLITKNFIRKFKKYINNLSFLISMEGVGGVNDLIRGRGTFKKIDKAVKLLKKNNFKVEISTTINNININFYDKLIEYGKKNKIPINFNLFKIFKKSQKDLIISPKKYFDFAQKILNLRTRKKIDVGINNAAITSYLLGTSPRKECKATLSGLTINVDGKMVPCPFLDEIGFYENKELPIFGKDFVNKWKNNYFFKNFRKGNLNECQACSFIFCKNIKKTNPYGIQAFKKYFKQIRKVDKYY